MCLKDAVTKEMKTFFLCIFATQINLKRIIHLQPQLRCFLVTSLRSCESLQTGALNIQKTRNPSTMFAKIHIVKKFS